MAATALRAIREKLDGEGHGRKINEILDNQDAATKVREVDAETPPQEEAKTTARENQLHKNCKVNLSPLKEKMCRRIAHLLKHP